MSDYIIQKQQELLANIQSSIFPIIFIELIWMDDSKLNILSNTHKIDQDLLRLCDSYSSYYNLNYTIKKTSVLEFCIKNKLLLLL